MQDDSWFPRDMCSSEDWRYVKILTTQVLAKTEVHDRIEMAVLLFNGLRWEVEYWESAEDIGVGGELYEYFDSYDEAMDFLTMRLVLARML